jgi:putative protease
MSPVGYWPQLHAAIEAGADAVYFGLTHFTARAKVGFTLGELPVVMETLRKRGVKGYVTFNTLVFEHELREAARTLAAIASAGADAIIVQDIGIAQLARQIAPDLEVHGSTQMSITSAEGVELARQFGVSRVVLARELSLDEIRTIRNQTDLELEMFVHGALCVSYSGQCFSSEAWGGRSANRGQCAQACRLPYELFVDGQHRPLADARYLLSPGDLMTLDQIPAMVDLGIAALKIEGRYKDPNYVALTTRSYREAVDAAWKGQAHQPNRHERLQLEQVYSRGLGPFFVGGTNHQEVVVGRSPRHRGVLMGQVVRVLSDAVVIAPEASSAEMPLKPGDGVVFDAADWRSPEQAEEGGRVYQVVSLQPGQVEVRFGDGMINYGRIRRGDRLWRTHDPEMDRIAKPYTQANAPVHRQPVSVRATAHEGTCLTLEWHLVARPEISVTVISDTILTASQNRTVNHDLLREQLGRLGGTPYELAEVELDLGGRPFVPNMLLNQLRRTAVEQLSALQARSPSRTIHDPLAMLDLARSPRRSEATPATMAQLHLLVRTPEQLEAALTQRPASITLDYLELYGLRPSVEKVQAAGIVARVASPRVLKPSEQRIIRFLLKLECELVIRSSGLLQALQAEPYPPLIGDFSLNAANQLTAETLLNLGLTRITPTHDLNAEQVAELARLVGSERIEVIAYQHLPVFHTEHCVFCRFLSDGTSYKDCGHPCEKHRVALRDVNGRLHPVMADVGCRNTVFGAEAQTASSHLHEWRAAGIRHYRLEFVHETPEQVAAVTTAFQAALTGKLSGNELERRLQRMVPEGTTEGSLFVPKNYDVIPLLQ